ncbi:methyltransferase [Shewanella avicenniae]|uniref:tRNA1(Val) (adenine(37)-N6)-methyltransferase n=1 Tax=Shewanella avicenniae TaxID=2814294 RepID=A0ABX7QSJ4_9GAMM|nr:methyltransferase [Shewanella avicenniae]QSX34439.1 methyltransferase [Shewanella avicenniae]
MGFTFKQFHVDDFGCGMPVSTDSVLLGSWAPINHAKRVLDIGAGSGLLSLMAAQRNSLAIIDAVELDETAANTCVSNVANSPWAAQIRVHQQSIQQFTEATLATNTAGYDVILCNPPYFLNGPTAASNNRATARHALTLSFTELMQSCAQLLSTDGIACLVLPTVEAHSLIAAAKAVDLPLQLAVAVSSVMGKAPNRQLLLFSQQAAPADCIAEDFAILVQHGQYTDTMRRLTQDFYLKL